MSQCKQALRTYSRSRGYLFRMCLKEAGHAGDHRGDRCQWYVTRTGKLKIVKPPTEKLP